MRGVARTTKKGAEREREGEREHACAVAAMLVTGLRLSCCAVSCAEPTAQRRANHREMDLRRWYTVSDTFESITCKYAHNNVAFRPTRPFTHPCPIVAASTPQSNTSATQIEGRSVTGLFEQTTRRPVLPAEERADSEQIDVQMCLGGVEQGRMHSGVGEWENRHRHGTPEGR